MSLPARQVSAPITPNAACAYSPRTTRPLRGLFSPLGIGRPKFTIGWQLSSRPKETRLAAASRSVIPSRRENTHVRSAALVREDAYSQKRIISGSRTTRRPSSGSIRRPVALAGGWPVRPPKGGTIRAGTEAGGEAGGPGRVGPVPPAHGASRPVNCPSPGAAIRPPVPFAEDAWGENRD